MDKKIFIFFVIKTVYELAVLTEFIYIFKGPYFYYVRLIVGGCVHKMLIIDYLHYINKNLCLILLIIWVGSKIVRNMLTCIIKV